MFCCCNNQNGKKCNCKEIITIEKVEKVFKELKRTISGKNKGRDMKKYYCEFQISCSSIFKLFNHYYEFNPSRTIPRAVEDLLNSRRIWLTEELWLQTRCNSHGLDETIFYLGKEALDNNINMTMNQIKLLKNHLDDINVMYTVPDFDDLKVMEDK